MTEKNFKLIVKSLESKKEIFSKIIDEKTRDLIIGYVYRLQGAGA